MNFFVNLNRCVGLNMKAIFLLIIIGYWVPVYAQQNDSLPSTQQTEKNKPSTEDNRTKRKPEPKERVFKPSEEISEDLPVPFPVDI